MIVIERMSPRDQDYVSAFNRLLAVLSKRAPTTTKEKVIKGLSDDDTYLFGAFDTERRAPDNLAGMALIFFQWRLEGAYSGIHGVAVDPVYQGRHIGDALVKRMLEAAQDYAKKNQEKFSIELTSNPNNPARHRAINLYLKYGFLLAAKAVDEHGTNLYKLNITP